MMHYWRDGALWTFGLIAAAALAVSAPATYSLIAPYHSDGTLAGVIATVALLIILEVGAVAAKLSTLWVREGRGWLLAFCWGALGINTLSNFVHGGSLAAERGLPWLAAWGGALIYAAFPPALLYLMLHLLCLRVLDMRGLRRTVADEVAETLRPVAHAVEVAQQAQRSLAQLAPVTQLPAPQEVYPRPEAVRVQPVLVPQSVCPHCGHKASRMQLQTAPQHGGWRCPCGYKVPLAEIGQ